MFRLLLAALLVLPATALAQQSFAGDYVYQTPQGPVTLTLRQQGDAVTGAMRGADGSMFDLQGALREHGAAGSIRTGDSVGFFAVGFVGQQLKMTVAELDPATGQADLSKGWSLDFSRTGGGTGVEEARSGMPRPETAQPVAPPAAQRDPALVGHWTHSNTYRSGDFFATTTLQMQVNPDGTYLHGRGNVSLGGAYQGNTGRRADVTAGQWRTQGDNIHVMEQGSPQWTPYARYYIEGASLMLTFGDGSRQVWERVR